MGLPSPLVLGAGHRLVLLLSTNLIRSSNAKLGGKHIAYSTDQPVDAQNSPGFDNITMFPAITVNECRG